MKKKQVNIATGSEIWQLQSVSNVVPWNDGTRSYLQVYFWLGVPIIYYVTWFHKMLHTKNITLKFIIITFEL